MVRRGFSTWEEYHRTARRLLGREVELVGVPLADLVALNLPRVEICRDIFAHNVIYNADKLFRDIPEFRPRVSLEAGMSQVIAVLDRDGKVPDSDTLDWEDRIISAQRSVRVMGI